MTEKDSTLHEDGPNRAAMRFGPYRLLKSQRLLLDGSRPVPMSSRAMDILLALVEQPGRVLSRDDLITRAWPDTTVDNINLRVHVSALRRALGDGQEGQPYLITIPGRGYRFVGALAAEAAPLLSPDTPRARPAALPLPLARTIGRSALIDRIRTLLPAQRFVTLAGPGGMGKTTVAMAVADSIGSAYPDDVQWVDLATLDRDESVPAAIAFALGLANFSTDPSPGVAASLRDKAMLLILDSCERVVAGVARMVERIRHSAPNVHILATSREPLRARGEHVVRLPPLGSPPDPGNLSVAQAMEYPAVQLFVERASAIVDGFSLNSANVSLVAGICARLDGIALAIELAAGHLAAFELQSLAAMLDDKFRVMATGRRTALPRHRTMQATLEWSYETLPEQERLVLRRFAVFGGAADLPAIRAIVADAILDQNAVLAGLVRLVDKSLVATETSGVEVRYRLLDTTHAYALEKLVAGGERDAIASRHAQYYHDYLRKMEAEGNQGSNDHPIDLAADIANIRAALDWAASPEGDASIHVALTIAAVPLWMRLSLLSECRTRVNQALIALERDPADGSGREMALRAALGMSLMYTRGPVDESEATWARVLELAESIDDTEYQLRALYGLWLYKTLVCEYRAALDFAQRFRSVAERGAATGDLATSERMMAMALHYLGDQEGTRTCAERSLEAPVPTNRHFQTTHYGVDQRVGAFVLLARALWLQGLPDQAVRAAQASVDEATEVGHANSMCVALADGASLIAILVGDVAETERFAGMLNEHAEHHALGVWRTYATALRGWILMHRDAATDGAALLRSALADLRGTPFDIRFQLYLVWLAETLRAAGQTGEALAAINEALERAERMEERWYLPELLRIRGELLVQDGAVDAASACFVQSLNEAQEQGTLSWELRTAMSLARLRSDQVGLLRSVIDRFGEGFLTADVIAAKHLLAELER
jgi:predicted ATPase/DNA-binding winged helix-turn-helix (wHTH) protein